MIVIDIVVVIVVVMVFALVISLIADVTLNVASLDVGNDKCASGEPFMIM